MLILFCYLKFYFILVLTLSCLCYLMRDKMGMNPDGREDRKELGGRKGGETIYLHILCEKKTYFQ